MVLSMLAELCPAEAREPLFAAGIAPLQGLHDGLTAIAHAAWFGERERAMHRAPPPLPASSQPLIGGDVRMLDEAESKRRLAMHGVTVPAARLVAADGVLAAGEELGFPVVLKAVSEFIAHKSEAGAVAVGLRDQVALDAALVVMRSRLAAAGIGCERFLVERMVEGVVVELIVGASRDPQFGPTLVLGAGGVMVELVADSTPLLLPVMRAEVETALDRLRVARLLDGFRGGPRADRAALVDTVLALAGYVTAHADRLLELDVNPLMVLAEGRGVVAADALIRLVE